jgi:hypothetical protein
MTTVHLALPPQWRSAANVAVASSVDGWRRRVAVSRRGFELPVTARMPLAYKFIVDGRWQHDATSPVEADGLGGFNNIVSVSRAPPRW